MSAGLTVSSDLESQYQWIAADVDRNGLIQAKDAWLINQYVAGLSAESSSAVGSWEFYDSSTNLESLSAVNTSPPELSSLSGTLSESDNVLDVTSVLKGDIDGSLTSFL